MARPTTLQVPTDAHQVWRQALDATRGALILTDALHEDNPIVFANQAFLDLTGYSHKEVLGRNCRFLQGPGTEPDLVNTLRLAVHEHTEARVTLRNYRKDGTMFWNDLLMSPIKNEEGEVTHFIGMQLDITERIEREQALRQSRDRLKQSNRELEQFTYAASHDLQEPLRMVRSFMQLVDERYGESLDDDGRSFVNFAIDGAVRMQTLIDDLLQLSRIRTRGQPPTPILLTDALGSALANLQPAIEEAGARIDYDAVQLPEVMADRSQLIMLLQNLISNAIKYHREDQKPEVTVTAEQVVSSPEWTEVTVTDNGIGIDRQYHERIFDVFQRLHTRDEYPGTGVGLSICRQIVERQGGQLHVRSSPDHGSSFSFTLPMVERGPHS